MLVYPVVQGGASPSSKLELNDISPTKTIVNLELNVHQLNAIVAGGHHPQ